MVLAEDKSLALRTLDEFTEHQLGHHRVGAPWDPGIEREIGSQFSLMVRHLESHKAQLFYYLKMQGKPVNTGDLWGA